MERNYSNSDQNPTAVWQGRWARSLDEIIFSLTEYDAHGAWNSLLNLKAILPPLCEEDTEELFKKTDKIIHRTFLSYTYVQAARASERYLRSVGIAAERELLTAVKKSLFERGWINKDFSVGPRSSRTAKIGE